MATSFAALLYRPADIPERALSQGFAVALGGWDVAAPHLLIAPVPGLDGWSAAFYSGGAKLAGDDELEHWCDLFEDELSPPGCVLDVAAELGHPEARAYALIFSDELLHDEAHRVDAVSATRRFVREGDEGLEAGIETSETSELIPLDYEASEATLTPYRGSTFLSAELGIKVVPALVSALFMADQQVPVRLCGGGEEAIIEATIQLADALRRTPGRGTFAPPEVVAGVAVPPTYRAFVEAYDWEDPADPEDLYRGLSIGAIEGVLRFLRPSEIVAKGADPRWAGAAKGGAYPIARLAGSALGGAEAALIGLGADGESLVIVRGAGAPRPAGPLFCELLRYLALGWSTRSDPEEDLIGALMLRARLRSEAR